MSILLHFLASFLGATAFLFLFWRRLKEDYSAALIFNTGLAALLGIFLGFVVHIILSPKIPVSEIINPGQFWFWTAFLGLIIALKISATKFKVKMVETFEALLLGSWAWLIVVYTLTFIQSPTLSALVPIVLMAILISLFHFLEAHYRGFSWYKSGRVGFSGLAVAGIFFTLRVVFALIAPQAFLLSGKIEIVISGIVAFLLFFSLYNLSEA